MKQITQIFLKGESPTVSILAFYIPSWRYNAKYHHCTIDHSRMITFRTSHRMCSLKKVFLKTFQNSQEKTCVRFSFLIKLHATFIKWSNTFKQIVGKLPTICLSVFDHFSGLAFKGLNDFVRKTPF